MRIPNPTQSPGGQKPLFNRTRLLCSVFILQGSVAVGPAAFAQFPLNAPTNPLPQTTNAPPGLCYLGQQDISGSWVNDGTGELVPLAELCKMSIHQHFMTMPEVETEFWQAFVMAANADALAFATDAGVEEVITYGQTICPSLDELGTMDELRVLQAQGGLPASFDAAVNVAAIHTYCPDRTRSIGR